TQLSAGRGGSSALVFNAQGEVINERPASVAANASQATYNYLDMLHQARFADTLTRWLLFFAGILGTIMVGTGSVLWVVKRAKQQLGEFGFELIRGSNIGSMAGLMCATGGYFWVNRLLPADLTSRSL
ncbi:MAG: PepSY-associated TM helix domain-containing protein, partial [Pseudomonadota bacterium]|nr:PepSY-associated TM helix domain-containing protein [Pseudomonadota bacterium]